MDMKKILLVEDDDLLNKTLTYNLISEGYDTVSALNAGTATELLTQTEYDLVLLDINLPDGSGLDLCEEIRERGQHTYIIFITANDKESDMLKGYEAGGADYVTKPFHIRELLARIFVQLKNSDGAPGASVLSYDDITLHTDTHMVNVKDTGIKLTRTEFAILKLLMQNSTQIMTKSLLLDQISQDTPDCTESSLKIHICNLRKKLREINEKDYIESVWGIGFKLRQSRF